MSNNFANKTPKYSKYVVKNLSSKEVRLFGVNIKPGREFDLLSIPGVSQSEIFSSVLKDEIGPRLRSNPPILIVIENTIDLITIALSDTDYTLDPVYFDFNTIIFTGTLSATRNITFPNYGSTDNNWIIKNNTNQFLNIKTPSSSGKLIQAGLSELVLSDGSSILKASGIPSVSGSAGNVLTEDSNGVISFSPIGTFGSIIGGYRTVADITARNAISAPLRTEGMLVYVQSNDNTYKLNAGLTNSDWIITIPNASGTTGNVLTENSDGSSTYLPATVLDTNVTGGFRAVADITARNAITVPQRKEGMYVYVQSSNEIYKLGSGLTNSDWLYARDNVSISNLTALAALNDAEYTERAEFKVLTVEDFFYLDKTSTLTADGITIVNSLSSSAGASPGRWIRRPSFSTNFLSQRTWFVDPQGLLGGNDENSGATSLLPLRTFKELNRRVWAHLGYLASINIGRYLVNILSNTNLGDSPTFFGNFSSAATPSYKGNIANDVVFKAFYTTVLTGGIVSASTFINAATNDTITITDVTTTWATYINGNYAIRFTSGTLSGCFAFPVKDLGAGKVVISLPYLSDFLVSSATTIVASAAVAPGTTYEIVQMATCPELNLELKASSGAPTIMYQYLHFTGADAFSLPTISIRSGPFSILMYQCVIRTLITQASRDGSTLLLYGCLLKGQTVFPSQNWGILTTCKGYAFASAFTWAGTINLGHGAYLQLNSCVLSSVGISINGSSAVYTVFLSNHNTFLGTGGLLFDMAYSKLIIDSGCIIVGSGFATFADTRRGGNVTGFLSALSSAQCPITFTGPLVTFDGLGYALPPQPMPVPSFTTLTAIPTATSLNSLYASPWLRAAVASQTTAKVLLFGADGISYVAFT